jgi:ubiquinone/menaquinone biosynthesis C-methylase UbiE
MDHNRVIRKAFSKQASSFEDQGLTLSSPEILSWIVANLPLQHNYLVLDVAAGTGHLSRAIAPHVKKVVAIDITPEMLEQARNESERMGIDNMLLERGDAQQLPYKEYAFDMVVSRLAIHHFENPSIQLREMVRVCKPHQIVGVIDLLSPEDGDIAETYNHLERLRDPSHTTALSKTEMGKLLSDTGIAVKTFVTQDVKVDFERWAQMTATDHKTKKHLRGKLLQELGDGSKTGMRPFMENGALKFLQVWSIVIGMKMSREQRT